MAAESSIVCCGAKNRSAWHWQVRLHRSRRAGRLSRQTREMCESGNSIRYRSAIPLKFSAYSDDRRALGRCHTPPMHGKAIPAQWSDDLNQSPDLGIRSGSLTTSSRRCPSIIFTVEIRPLLYKLFVNTLERHPIGCIPPPRSDISTVKQTPGESYG